LNNKDCKKDTNTGSRIGNFPPFVNCKTQSAIKTD
jgi:hypothetical protein